jgi:hypothetical protein
METDKATRIYIILAELIGITDSMPNPDPDDYYESWRHKDFERLRKLRQRPEYQEMKDWLEAKK